MPLDKQQERRSAEGDASGRMPGRGVLRGRRANALRRPFVLPAAMARVEAAIYLVVAALLVVAAVFTIVGTVQDVIEGSKSRQIADTGVFLLDRVLLVFIIAELLYTLRLVNLGGQIMVEPFLFIGLIAVVRRILVITAEIEGKPGSEITDLVVQLGVLGGLIIVLAGSIWFLRRSGVPSEPQPGEAPPQS
jgi:uncharacterized membrane protein (DUF373 family)